MFREGYASMGANRAQQCRDKEFVTLDWVEPTFDAADIIRCGEDVFVLHGQSCNMAGFEWIRRTLGRRGIRAHQVHHPNILNPNHIDASIMPLRPGLLLATPPVIDDCKVIPRNNIKMYIPLLSSSPSHSTNLRLNSVNRCSKITDGKL